MKSYIIILLSTICVSSWAQPVDNLILKGDYSYHDSINITKAYINASIGVSDMNNALDAIWQIDKISSKSKKQQREEKWRSDRDFMRWLGEPKHMNKARRKIVKMNAKFQDPFILKANKEDVGRCGRFVSAWTIPYGKVKIRLCRNFLNFSAHNQEKTIIHELGHEAGLLFDRGVYHCRPALSVASNSKKNRARHRPENYAWLAMSYLGVECNSRRYISPQSY